MHPYNAIQLKSRKPYSAFLNKASAKSKAHPFLIKKGTYGKPHHIYQTPPQ